MPGVGRLVGELLVLPVEERVGRPGVGDDLVRDTGGGERRFERVDILLRDARVVPSHEPQHRAGHAPDPVDGP